MGYSVWVLLMYRHELRLQLLWSQMSHRGVSLSERNEQQTINEDILNHNTALNTQSSTYKTISVFVNTVCIQDNGFSMFNWASSETRISRLKCTKRFSFTRTFFVYVVMSPSDKTAAWVSPSTASGVSQSINWVYASMSLLLSNLYYLTQGNVFIFWFKLLLK